MNLKKIGNLLLLNLIWILFSLPIITVGGATCAAFSVTIKMAKEEDCNVWKQFLKGFKQSWFQGCIMGIIIAFFIAAGVFIWKKAILIQSILPLAGAIIYTLIAISMLFFTLPLIARYSNKLVNIIRNSMSIFIQFPKPAFKCVLLAGIEIVILIFSNYVFFLPLLFMPALICYTISLSVIDFFERLENPPAPSSDDTEEDSEEEDEETSDSE